MAGEEQQRDFAELLEEMPRIAKVVNAFSDEQVQKQAFDALLGAFYGGGTDGATTNRETKSAEVNTSQKRQGRKPKAESPDAVKRQRRSGGSPTAVRDLDLVPKGKTSLKDFVAEKQPKTQHDQNVLSVYYLAEVLGVEPVTLNHVFTCYKDMRWREPANLANSLALTTNRKRFLDTANLDDIKLTPAGRNHVQYDLPPKKGE
jgi:hypothetical protein